MTLPNEEKSQLFLLAEDSSEDSLFPLASLSLSASVLYYLTHSKRYAFQFKGEELLKKEIQGYPENFPVITRFPLRDLLLISSQTTGEGTLLSLSFGSQPKLSIFFHPYQTLALRHFERELYARAARFRNLTFPSC